MREEVWRGKLPQVGRRWRQGKVLVMAIIAEWINLEKERVVSDLLAAAEKLTDATGEVVLDFVSVRRIDSNALRAMEGLARRAEEKAVKIVLSGVNVDLYKVLKLTKLAGRFSFMSGDREHGATKLEGRHAEPSTE
jgi:anti-anti-sigma regulatory factor